MKYLVAFILVGLGLASAFSNDLDGGLSSGSAPHGPMIDRLKEAFERIVNKMKERFDSGNGVRGGLMKKAEDMFEKLKNLKVEVSDKIKSIFEDMRKKMGRNDAPHGPMIDRLKEAFERIVNKMKERFDSGSGVRGGLMKKAEDIFEKLKNLKVEVSDKIKSIFEDMRKKMGRTEPMLSEGSFSNLFGLLRRLKQLINDEVDFLRLKEKVEELFGTQSEIAKEIIEMLETKGEIAKQKILDWIDRILSDKEKRSTYDVIQKLQVFLQFLQRELFETFKTFERTKIENIDEKARKFTTDTYFRIQEKLLQVLRDSYGISR